MSTRKTKRETFQDQLRRLIGASPMSRYEICKRAELAQATMSRFWTGQGSLSLPSVDRLCEVLDLQLAPRRKQAGRTRGR